MNVKLEYYYGKENSWKWHNGTNKTKLKTNEIDLISSREWGTVMNQREFLVIEHDLFKYDVAQTAYSDSNL